MTNSYLDAPRLSARRSRWGARDLGLISVFAALMAALTLVPAIPVGPLGVPITLQTLAVSLVALCLGGLRGSVSVLLYVVVGLAGVPVFAKFTGGLGVLAGPTAGYLLAFPLAALVAGSLATFILRRKRTAGMPWLFAAAMAGSILMTHPLGILGMSINGQIPWAQAVVVDLAYWPGDIIKNIIAALVAVMVFKAFPRMARREFDA
ncbi:MAG: biotin transporter BioY [Arthrobacter sp.]|uniref:biotin transporter BioY n=1 Tax=unclassified Arthrobacter TaxID=235627 RepID=UPI00264D240E|nr:biotin transporter BioY [Micrococcaceae bacterium]MDN5812912.1 biotin transporter BioY [Micrococcaceae bacterium]MDN6201970.1 biotin transporter BioY [Micrococcaceae bacterium]